METDLIARPQVRDVYSVGAASIVVAALMVTPIGQLTAAQASGDERIEVAASQRVTIQGQFHSLKKLVEDICWQAGVEIYSYDAADREVAVRYRNVPLYKVLRRLLRNDSHTMGFRSIADGAPPEVAWLRVMGDATSARRNKSYVSNTAKPRPFKVPSDLLYTAFAGADGAQRDAALRTLTERISSDPDQLRQFLAIEPREIADAVRRYPGSAQTLEGIRKRTEIASLRSKLDEIIAELK